MIAWVAAALAAEPQVIALAEPSWAIRLWEAHDGALVTARHGDTLRVRRYADDGKLAFDVEVGCDDPTATAGALPKFAVLDGTFACSRGNAVVGYSAENGVKSWAWTADAPVTSLGVAPATDNDETSQFAVATRKSVALVSVDRGRATGGVALPAGTPTLAAISGRTAVFVGNEAASRWAAVPLFETRGEKKKHVATSWTLAEPLGPPEIAGGTLTGVSNTDVVTIDPETGQVLDRLPRDLVGGAIAATPGVIVAAPGTIALVDPKTRATRWASAALGAAIVHADGAHVIAASDNGFEAWDDAGAPLGSGTWSGVVAAVAATAKSVFALLEIIEPRPVTKTQGQGHHPEAPRPPAPVRSKLVIAPMTRGESKVSPPKSLEWVEGTELSWRVDGAVSGRLVQTIGKDDLAWYQDDALVAAEAPVQLIEPPPTPGAATTWVPGWEVPVAMEGSPGNRIWILKYPGHPTVLLRESNGQRVWLAAVDIP